MKNLQIEKTKQVKDKLSESIFQKLYPKHIIKNEYEFGVRTNELIYCDKENRPEGYGFPDFLLKMNDETFVAEITTAHDLDDPNAHDAFRPVHAGFVSGDITGKISARINSKMTKGNFKNVDDFHLPIILVVFNNKFSSQIDEKDIGFFMNDLRGYLPENQKMLLSLPNYWVIEKIPKHNLISGILFIKTVSGSNQIKYFHNNSSKNKLLSKQTIKILEN